MGGERRKTFVAREDLLEEMSIMAKSKGKTLYETVNETFESALAFNSLGLNPKDALKDCGKLKSLQERGYVLCLENLWSDINTIAFMHSKEKSMEAWYAAGRWLAMRLKSNRSDSISGSGSLSGSARLQLEDLREELASTIWNLAELSVEEKGEEVRVNLISPRMSKELSELVSTFLSGAFEASGYEAVEKSVRTGNIRHLYRYRKSASGGSGGL